MVEAGYLEATDVRNNAQRSALLAALGQDDDFVPSVEREPHAVASGDAFLLCTDGLWACVNENEMERVLGEYPRPEEWLRALEGIVLARAAPWHDNYSAIAVCCR
jgi:serine/threonine protein phosphatase PrpC